MGTHPATRLFAVMAAPVIGSPALGSVLIGPAVSRVRIRPSTRNLDVISRSVSDTRSWYRF